MNKRHPAITTIAILHFIFGGLLSCCGACGVGATAGQNALLDFQKNMIKAQGQGGQQQKAFQDQAKQVEMQEEMMRLTEQKIPHGNTVQIAMSSVSLLFGVILVVAGFGLLKVRPWARIVSILYGIVDLLLGILHLVWTLAVHLPGQGEVMQEMVAKEGQDQEMLKQMAQYSQMGGPLAVGWILFMMLYPLVVLVVMFWPSVAAAFHADGGSLPPLEQDDLRPEDRWRV